MAREHRLRHRFEFRRLPLEVGARPAPPLRRVARELHAIDREHLAADEPLRHRRSRPPPQRRGRSASPRVLTKCAIVVKCGAVIAAERDEGHLLLARRSIPRLLTMPCAYATSTTLRSSAGGYAGAPVVVVLKPRIEGGEIDRVLEQVIHRVLERAGEELAGEIDGSNLDWCRCACSGPWCRPGGGRPACSTTSALTIQLGNCPARYFAPRSTPAFSTASLAGRGVEPAARWSIRSRPAYRRVTRYRARGAIQSGIMPT